MVSTTSDLPTTQPEPPPPGPPALSPRELARWAWRQLTSMRTALILLFLLALAAVPGSVVPQEAVDSVRAAQWRDDHPRLTPVYEALGLFDVYGSVWFSAIYILLMISLVGCFIPRIRLYWRGLRVRPPQAPSRLARMPEHASYTTDESPETVLERAHAELRGRRFRADRHDGSVAAEKGYLREAGNLLFHVSVLVVLVGFAIGGLWGFRGGVILVTKDSFANTLSQYDEFRAGPLFQPRSLVPFDFTVDDFDVTFIREGRDAGMAREFAADLSYRPGPGEADRQRTVSVNHPLSTGGTDVFLIGHGYAPRITVRNADGTVAFSGPVVFLPEDSTFRSFGVVKVPDAQQKNGSTQIGLEGEFYPTYAFTQETGPFTAFPEARNPAISMIVWTGDLGLDDGRPQSVYALEKSQLTKLRKADGNLVRLDLAPGRRATLPNGLGTVSLDGVERFVKVQVSHTPGRGIALGGAVLGLVGLMGSLFIRPRRVWVRARRDEAGRTLVEVAGLDRSSGGNLAAEVSELTARLRGDEQGSTTGSNAGDTTGDPR